ncbi:MAG: hypothetical protein ACPHET_06195 [Miltoncostaeaceae bacterium]
MILRRPKARIDVEMPAAGMAAVRITYPAGGTGRPPAADDLDLALGLIAWGFHRTHENEVRGIAERVRDLATAIAASPDGSLPAGTVRVGTRSRGTVDVALIPWSGDRGLTRITCELAGSAVGPVPVVKGSPSAAALVIAGLAAAMWLAGEGDADDRLALALSLEGLTAWYREAHRMTPARDAVHAARNHAADRLRDAGRVPPTCLAGAPA